MAITQPAKQLLALNAKHYCTINAIEVKQSLTYCGATSPANLHQDVVAVKPCSSS